MTAVQTPAIPHIRRFMARQLIRLFKGSAYGSSPLTPEAVALRRLLGRRPRTSLDKLAAIRRNAVANAYVFATPDLTVRAESCTVDGIGARRYAPAAQAERALIYFHGGAYVSGTLDSHDALVRRLATTLRAVVVAVDYRLAPDNPALAAYDDAARATRWALNHPERLGIAGLPLGVGGDSAGGGLAAAVVQSTRHDPRQPAYQLLLWPWLDLRCESPTHDSFGTGYLLETDWLKTCAKAYAGDLIFSEAASPLLTPDLSGLPPALILVAGCDPLKWDGERYAERLAVAKTPVAFATAERLPHGFLLAADICRPGVAVFETLVDAFRTRPAA